MSKTRRLTVDDSLIDELFSHQKFKSKLLQFQTKTSPNTDISPTKINKFQNHTLNSITKEICQILSQHYRQSIEQQSLNLYQSHVQILKEIQQLKSSKLIQSPSKTQFSSGQRQRFIQISLFSQASIEQQKESPQFKRNINTMTDKIKETSFLHSFICENGSKQFKQELQEKINANNACLLNLSGEINHFQTEVRQKLNNIEANLNSKMEGIYKTLTTLFQTINDLQSGQEQKLNPKPNMKRVGSNKLLTLGKKRTEDNDEKIVNKTTFLNGSTSVSGHRTFLGFLKY